MRSGNLSKEVNNLFQVPSDWENRTQGIWISPKCPRLPDGSSAKEGDSQTGFKASLIRYLKFYEVDYFKFTLANFLLSISLNLIGN